MPIDASIPLGTRGVGQIVNPLEIQQQIQSMQVQRQQAQALEEQRRAIAEQRQAQTGQLQAVQRQDEALRQLFNSDQLPTPNQIINAVGPERGVKVVEGLRALQTNELKDYDSLQKVIGSTVGAIKALPEDMRGPAYDAALKVFTAKNWIKPDQVQPYSPESLDYYQRWAMTPKEQWEADNPKPIAAPPPGQSLLDPKTLKPLYTSPEAPEKPPTAGSFADYLTSVAQAKGRKVDQLTPQDKLKAKTEYEAAGRAPTGESERPSVWLAKDGEMRYVTPSQAAQLSGQGWRPGSTREQGRPVTSGDAGRVADYDTSLDDLEVLERDIGRTGTGSKIGAMLPNVVTDLTGWGADSKTRQAVIDRVKQVIGKALEGGVLRKEDEYKYEKILPTIGDQFDVAQAKLKGLNEAIVKRRQTQIDALEDAGFDVSGYKARAPHGKAKQPTVGERRMINGQLGEWDGTGWKAVTR